MEPNRSKIILRSGYLFILTNFLLAIFNIIVGVLSHSLAVVSDAIHSLTDSISGFLIIISEKLASHKKYSGNREKIERITTILIALIIVAVGVHIIIESIEKILSPEEVDYSFITIFVIVISIITKYLLAFHLKTNGKKIKSKVVVASGVETMNDALVSVAVLISAIIYLIWQVDIESYISIIIAFIIIKTGLEFIFPHLTKHHHHHFESNPDHDHCGKTHTQ